MSIREKYNIPDEAKVLLYVGNISKNKNQAQMVRVFGLLPPDVRKNTWVVFCGENHAKNCNLENLIVAMPDHEHLIMCGGVDKEIMPSFYQAADGVVLLSFAEGFGLSLIEGMHFGLPCAMPCDLDAFHDIYRDDVAIAINNRDDIEVSSCIAQLISKNWNKNAIREFSKEFNSESMAKKYIDVYYTVLQ